MDLKQLKESISLLERVSDSQLKQIGPDTYRVNPCPICGHKDHFTIYAKSNTYSSFSGCCRGGSIIDYLVEVEDMDQAQAISKAKELAGVADSPEAEGEPIEKMALPIVDKAQQNNDYYYNRGLTDKTIEKYRLGYLPDGHSLGTAFKYYLPVSDTFYIMRSDKDGKERYRNAGKPELFNAKYLQDPSLTGGFIFVTEGLFDALSLEELERPAISLNSNSMADTFIKAVEDNRERLGCKTFVLALDNDNPGRETTAKIKAALEAMEMPHIGFDCRDYKDINEWLIDSPQGLREALEAIPLEGTSYQYLKDFFEADQVKRMGEPDIKTNFHTLDRTLGGGLYPGLYVLGSISSLGKTALALQMADRIAEQEQPVLFFSLEMGRYELTCRSLTRVFFEQTQNKELTTGHVLRSQYHGDDLYPMPAFQRALEAYRDGPAKHLTLLEGDFDIDVIKLKRQVKDHIYRTGKKPVVMIDYLQVLRPLDMKMNEKQTVDFNIIGLKRMARDIDTPVVVVSSFNRASYNGQAAFEAFKESGSIEYTADVVMAMQLRGKSDKDDTNELKNRDPRPLELVILKNRRGKAYEVIPLDYWPRQNYFAEL